MESVLSLDRTLFLLINKEWASSWADVVFPNITDLHKTAWFWIPFCAGLLALFLSVFKKKQGLILFAAFAVTVGISDAFSSKLVKPLFERLRPTEAGLDMVLRCPHYGGASFPSTHASNMFCAALFLSFFFPKARWPLIGLAFLVAYSRVYCGVHYPMDVLFGAVQGSLIGGLLAFALQNYSRSPLRGLKWQKFL